MRQGARRDEVKKCRRGGSIPFRLLSVPGKKPLYEVRWVKIPTCEKGFCNCKRLQGIIRVLAGLPEMAPPGRMFVTQASDSGRSL